VRALLAVLVASCGSDGTAVTDPDGGNIPGEIDASVDPLDGGGPGTPDGGGPGTPDGGGPGTPDGGGPGTPDGGGPGTADAGTSPWIVPPLDTCTPTVDKCAAPTTADPGIYASYRKDAYLPQAQYNEYPPDPTSGGRVQIATVAKQSGTVAKVIIDGVDAESIFSPATGQTAAFEWTHVWPRQVVAGEPIWVAFHSRSATWDGKTQAVIKVELAGGGVAVDGSFTVAKTPAPITYVTVSQDRASIIVHVRNDDTAPRTLARLLVNGRDVTQTACIPDKVVAPGTAAMFTVPLCTPASLGQAWTVVADWQGIADAVGVGRVLKPRFALETYNNTSECPYPGGKADQYARLRSAGIDTAYIHGGSCGSCGCDTRNVLETLLPQAGDYFAVVSKSVGFDLSPKLANTSGIAAWETGDESDGEIYDSMGVPNAAKKAKDSRELWQTYPEIPTFNGAKTNKHIGTFAGMADIQGIDLYVAACAPHITMFGNHPPIRGAYDYLRNARNNHMPGTTWLYSQGLSAAWNDKTPAGMKIHAQPDPQEILVQALSVVAAGGKGLMWFQVNAEEATLAPARWQAISQATRIIRAVRELLRLGDPTGMVQAPNDVIAEAVRAPGAIVVPVINLQTTMGPDDISCAASDLTGQVPHWVLASRTADVKVRIPDDLGVVDVFEVTAAGVVQAPAYSVSGREIRFGGLGLSNAQPVRLLVIAESTAVRSGVAAELLP
jgi:hypothetical protein